MHLMSVRKGQARLNKLSKQLTAGTALSAPDREFLGSALAKIANGEDAEKALDVKAKRGERKGQQTAIIELHRQFAMAWIATATAPIEEGGLGITLKDATTKIKEQMKNLPTEESIRRYWNEIKETQEQEFEIKTD